MQEYGDIDIALDPIPYNGGTTSLQALWMGVPVVALAGGNFVGRMGASFMNTLGHSDWVAYDADEYVEIAVGLAKNCADLRGNRRLFHEQMAASPLCDIKSYVTHFEDLLDEMWVMYCNGGQQKVIRIE